MLRRYYDDLLSLFKYYRMRFIFSLIGIAVGVGSICALVALNNIVNKNSEAFMNKFGGSRFVLNIMTTSSQDNRAIKEYLGYQHVEKLSQYFKEDYSLIPYKLLSAKVLFDLKPLEAIPIAVSTDVFSLMQWQIQSGRKLHPLDKNDKVAVVGSKIAQNLHELGVHSLIGQSVNVDDHFFTIIGILEEKEFNPILDFDVNYALLFDLHLLGRFENSATIDSFIVQGKKGDLVTAQHKLNLALTKILGKVRFFFKDALLFEQALFKQVNLTMRILTIVAGVTLLLGIVSILNLLFILIEERKKEIGLRMSLGATASDIRNQFLIESLSLCLLGGCCGLFLGQIGAFCIVKSLSMTYFWQFSSLLLSILITIVIGLSVGFLPANMATRLDPVKLINS